MSRFYDAAILSANETAYLEIERDTSGLSDDAILPVHFYHSQPRKQQHSAEMRLMCAVLENAVRCFERNLTVRGAHRRRLFRETELWLFEKGDKGLFSFENVCDTLGLNPGRIRSAISRRKGRLLAGDASNRIGQPRDKRVVTSPPPAGKIHRGGRHDFSPAILEKR